MTLHIAAYRTTAINDVRALVQRVRGATLVRADRVYGKDHLAHAAALAARAVAEGRARSADVATETLLYAAGERQLQRAFELVGLKEGAREIAVVAWSDFEPVARELGWARDDALLEGDAGVLDAFGVTPEERVMFPRERWGDLILERVALVDVLKA